jgi:hypothetical protein
MERKREEENFIAENNFGKHFFPDWFLFHYTGTYD